MFWGRVGRAFVLLVVSVALSSCAPVHDPKLTGVIERGATASITSQIDYAKAFYKSPNSDLFGDLGGVDCVNFASQTLLARGWVMDSEWWHSQAADEPYSRAWISSTGFRDYLAKHPKLATELPASPEALVKVGDIVQFDWDASGDRDHTAVVSGLLQNPETGEQEILVTSHSPAAFDWPLDDVLAENDARTVVYFWSLN